MPDMDGVELAKKIKEFDKKQKIIISSGEGDTRHLINLINIGVDRFITKPVDYGELNRHIEDFIQSNYFDELVATTQRELASKNHELQKQLRVMMTRTEQLNRVYKAHAKDDEKVAYHHAAPDVATFAFENDDIGEMVDIEDEIDGIVNKMYMGGELSSEMCVGLSKLYGVYSKILGHYPFLFSLATGIKELSVALYDVKNIEATNSKQVILQHLESFTFTLIKWRKDVLSGTLKDINVFDNSMLADIRTLILAVEGRLEELEGDIEFF